MREAVKILKAEEGFRSQPYHCTTGWPTIGYGRVIGKCGDPLPDITVSEDDELILLEQRIERTQRAICDLLEGLDQPRRAVMISMAYQLGVAGLRGFRYFLASIKNREWEMARDHMLDSRWAKQTPNRARRHAEVILTGSMAPYE